MTPTVHATVVGLALAALLAAIAVSDWRHYRVPDRLTSLALGLRALDILASPSSATGDDLLQAAGRAVAMAAMFYGFRLAYLQLRGQEGMGLGDVKLAGVAGAWVDWSRLPMVIEIAALIGVAVALFRAARAGSRVRANTRLPFAVGFAAAIFLGWQATRLEL